MSDFPFEIIFNTEKFTIISHLKCGFTTLTNIPMLTKIDNNENLVNLFQKTKTIFLYRDIYLRNISCFYQFFITGYRSLSNIKHIITDKVHNKINYYVKHYKYIDAYKIFLNTIKNTNIIQTDGHLSLQTDMISTYDINIDYFIDIDKNMNTLFELLETEPIHENASSKKYINSLLYKFILSNNKYKSILDELYKKDITYFTLHNL